MVLLHLQAKQEGRPVLPVHVPWALQLLVALAQDSRLGKQVGRKEPRGGRGVVELDAEMESEGEGGDMETKGWERGSSWS